MIQDLIKARNELNGNFVQQPVQRPSSPPEIQYLSAVDNNRKQAEAEARRIEQVRQQEELAAAEEMMSRQENNLLKILEFQKMMISKENMNR